MNKNIKEILEYLDQRKDYAIIAGFAAFLHTGVKSSLDVDIIISSKEVLAEIVKDFKQRRWKLIKRLRGSGGFRMVTLKKNNATFDIMLVNLTRSKQGLDQEVFKHKELNLRVVNKERLFIDKINGMSYPKRIPSKIKRDREVVAILRKKIDPRKLRRVLARRSDEFWIKGYI